MVRLMIGQMGDLVQRNQQRVSRKCLDPHPPAASRPNQRKVEALKLIRLLAEPGKSPTGRQRMLALQLMAGKDKQSRFGPWIMFS
jgi:hypothetical protein